MTKTKKSRAVAVKYKPKEDAAPKVIAKGQGKIAEKIIALAKTHGIHIHQDPDLVEVLANLDLNEEIPADLYTVVAELLAFVYGLNKKAAPR
jgi:flagellar biosynthesis protein